MWECGNFLFTDEGCEKLENRREFSKDVSLLDEESFGQIHLAEFPRQILSLLWMAIKNKGEVCDLYRLEADAVPTRIKAKNTLHPIDFLEALRVYKAIGCIPAVMIGVEPEGYNDGDC